MDLTNNIGNKVFYTWGNNKLLPRFRRFSLNHPSLAVKRNQGPFQEAEESSRILFV